MSPLIYVFVFFQVDTLIECNRNLSRLVHWLLVLQVIFLLLLLACVCVYLFYPSDSRSREGGWQQCEQNQQKQLWPWQYYYTVKPVKNGHSQKDQKWVFVLWLYITIPQVCLQFVIVVFPDHTHYFSRPIIA